MKLNMKNFQKFINYLENVTADFNNMLTADISNQTKTINNNVDNTIVFNHFDDIFGPLGYSKIDFTDTKYLNQLSKNEIKTNVDDLLHSSFIYKMPINIGHLLENIINDNKEHLHVNLYHSENGYSFLFSTVDVKHINFEKLIVNSINDELSLFDIFDNILGLNTKFQLDHKYLNLRLSFTHAYDKILEEFIKYIESNFQIFEFPTLLQCPSLNK